MNILALVKGDERYVFTYDDSSLAALLRTLGRFAQNPELSFTWYDAAVLSKKARENTPHGCGAVDGTLVARRNYLTR